MIKSRYTILLSLVLGILWMSCGVNDKSIVARVDNYAIHLGELKDALPKAKKPGSTTTEYEAALEQLITKQLKLIAAYHQGFDKDQDIQARIAETERRAVYQALIEKDLIEKYVPESDIKEYYKRSGEQVRVRQVFIGLPENAAEKDISESLRLLTNARNRVLRGEDFITIVKEYSSDSTTIKNGGDMGFLTWGSSLYDRNLLETAFNLKEGRISLPFRTGKGYHLIKVEERKKENQQPYESMKERIKQLLFKQRRKELETAYFDMIEKVKSENGVEYVDDNIRYFAESVKNTLAKPDSLKSRSADQFDGIKEEDKDRVLLTNRQGAFITIGKVIDDIRRFPTYKQPRLDNEKMVREWLERVVPYELLISKGYEDNLQNSHTVRQKITAQLEHLMLQRIENQEIHDKVKPTDADYKAYYEVNKLKYQQPETIKVQEIFVKDHSLGTELATRAKRGEDFSSLADQYNERSTTKNNHGMLGNIRKEQYGNVGKTAFEMSVGEIAGPIKMGKNYSIIKVLDREPKRQKTYEEAKNQLRSNVKIEMRKQREHEWMETLRSKSNVQVYEGILHKAFPSEDI